MRQNTCYFKNHQNGRTYSLEYGVDLLGSYFVIIRYGINLSISKHYLFDSVEQVHKKASQLQQKRISKGYCLTDQNLLNSTIS